MSTTGVTDLVTNLIERVARQMDGIDRRLEELRNTQNMERGRLEEAIRSLADDVATLKHDVADLKKATRDLDDNVQDDLALEEAKNRRHMIWVGLIATIITSLIGVWVAILNKQPGVPVPTPAPIYAPQYPSSATTPPPSDPAQDE